MSQEFLSTPARWALTSLALSMLMPSLDTSIANAGLPILASAFEATFQQVQWIVLAYLLAVTTLIVSVGRLGDGFGRRRLLMIGIGIFTSASLACALAPGLGWLIGARAVQGVGAAIMFALTVALCQMQCLNRGRAARWVCWQRCRRLAPVLGRRWAGC